MRSEQEILNTDFKDTLEANTRKLSFGVKSGFSKAPNERLNKIRNRIRSLKRRKTISDGQVDPIIQKYPIGNAKW